MVLGNLTAEKRTGPNLHRELFSFLGSGGHRELCLVLPTSPSSVLWESGGGGRHGRPPHLFVPALKATQLWKGWPEPDSSFLSGFVGHCIAVTLPPFVLSSLSF